eukprot:gene10002-1802_t
MAVAPGPSACQPCQPVYTALNQFPPQPLPGALTSLQIEADPSCALDPSTFAVACCLT